MQFDLEGVGGSNEAWHCAIKFVVVLFVCFLVAISFTLEVRYSRT